MSNNLMTQRADAPLVFDGFSSTDEDEASPNGAYNGTRLVRRYDGPPRIPTPRPNTQTKTNASCRTIRYSQVQTNKRPQKSFRSNNNVMGSEYPNKKKRRISTNRQKIEEEPKSKNKRKHESPSVFEARLPPTIHESISTTTSTTRKQKRILNTNNTSSSSISHRQAFVLERNAPFLALIEGIDACPSSRRRLHPRKGRILELPSSGQLGTWTVCLHSPKHKKYDLSSCFSLQGHRICLRHHSRMSLGTLQELKSRTSEGFDQEVTVSMVHPLLNRVSSVEAQAITDLDQFPESSIGSLSVVGFDGFTSLSDMYTRAAEVSTSLLDSVETMSHSHHPVLLPVGKDFSMGVSIVCKLSLESDYHVYIGQDQNLPHNPIVAVDRKSVSCIYIVLSVASSNCFFFLTSVPSIVVFESAVTDLSSSPTSLNSVHKEGEGNAPLELTEQLLQSYSGSNLFTPYNPILRMLGNNNSCRSYHADVESEAIEYSAKKQKIGNDDDVVLYESSHLQKKVLPKAERASIEVQGFQEKKRVVQPPFIIQECVVGNIPINKSKEKTRPQPSATPLQIREDDNDCEHSSILKKTKALVGMQRKKSFRAPSRPRKIGFLVATAASLLSGTGEIPRKHVLTKRLMPLPPRRFFPVVLASPEVQDTIPRIMNWFW